MFLRGQWNDLQRVGNVFFGNFYGFLKKLFYFDFFLTIIDVSDTFVYTQKTLVAEYL